MLKKIGFWIGSIKRYFSDVQTQVSKITNETINDEIEKSNDEKNENKEVNDK